MKPHIANRFEFLLVLQKTKIEKSWRHKYLFFTVDYQSFYIVWKSTFQVKSDAKKKSDTLLIQVCNYGQFNMYFSMLQVSAEEK